MTKTFYATFGSGHAGYPGYLQVDVDVSSVNGFDADLAAELEARKRINEATGGKWCGLYRSLSQMHPGDCIFRGHA